MRRKISNNLDEQTDIGALANQKISITPLSTSLLNKPAPSLLKGLCADLFCELTGNGEDIARTSGSK